MPKGKGSKITLQVFTDICSEMSNGETLSKALTKDGRPSRSWFFAWLDRQPSNIQDKYALARERMFDAWSDAIIDISDDDSNDTLASADGVIGNNAAVNRSRLRVDTRKWVLSKALPKKYGDMAGDQDLQTKQPETVTIIVQPKPE